MKRSRILTFSYNAAVTALFGRTSSDRIMQHAHTLVAELVADRELEDAVERPIIFICHSLGGIIVKRVSPPRISRAPSHHTHRPAGAGLLRQPYQQTSSTPPFHLHLHLCRPLPRHPTRRQQQSVAGVHGPENDRCAYTFEDLGLGGPIA